MTVFDPDDLTTLIVIKYKQYDLTQIDFLHCTAMNCKWTASPAWYPKTEQYDKYRTDLEAWKSQITSHVAQHKPGRAPDLRDVEYELSYTPDCTVCPKGDGDVGITDGNGSKLPDGLECFTCGTTWNVDGDNGVLKKPEPGEPAYIDPNQLTLDGI